MGLWNPRLSLSLWLGCRPGLLLCLALLAEGQALSNPSSSFPLQDACLPTSVWGSAPRLLQGP